MHDILGIGDGVLDGFAAEIDMLNTLQTVDMALVVP